MTERKKNISIGVVMILVSAVFLAATGFSDNDMYYMSYLALAVMLSSGVLYLAKSMKIDPEKEAEADENALSKKEWALVILFFVLSLLLFSCVGFYTTLFLMFIAMHAFVSKRNRRFRFRKTLVFSAVGIVCIYLIFGLVLNINFPGDVLLV